MAHPPRIQRMSALLANQIAAGEVVERPASVVKELLENAIDAGATQIQIDLEKSGIERIRIRDNGCGIVKDDLALALSRHASSKVIQPDDLLAITSLGFRGEALASIAAVAKVALTSKTAADKHAWCLQSQPADIEKPDLVPAAHPIGTTVEVQQLFHNIPARRKFLRSERTELLQIETTIKQLALGSPQVQIILKHHNSTLLTAKAVQEPTQMPHRIAAICNKMFMDDALFIDVTDDKLHLHGYVGQAASARTQADMQYFYVNGRIVRDKLMQHAIKMAYQEFISEGRYPCYVLYLTLPPEEVDVNVHPTKHEVRFYEARHVHDFVAFHLDKTLRFPQAAKEEVKVSPSNEMQYLLSDLPEKLVSQYVVKETAMAYQAAPLPTLAQTQAQNHFYHSNLTEVNSEEESTVIESETSLNTKKENFHYLSLQNKEHIAVEMENGLLILSVLRLQRLLAYETLLLATPERPLITHPLLLPHSLILTEKLSRLLEKKQAQLNLYGIQVNQVSEQRWLIRALPEYLKKLDLTASIIFFLEQTTQLSHEQFCLIFCKHLQLSHSTQLPPPRELVQRFLSLPNWKQHPFKAHRFIEF